MIRAVFGLGSGLVNLPLPYGSRKFSLRSVSGFRQAHVTSIFVKYLSFLSTITDGTKRRVIIPTQNIERDEAKFSGYCPPDESDPDYVEWEMGMLEILKWHSEQIKKGNVTVRSAKPPDIESPIHLERLRLAREAELRLLGRMSNPERDHSK